MEGPAILADTAEVIPRGIGALTNAHAGVAEQTEGIPVPIVAPPQFRLD
jgi:hypothetical protein